MKTLVIIPCYNEEENIKTVVENLKKSNAEVDYLIVNDCSTDKSAEICNENGFNYVDLSVNLGIGGGVQCGYMYAFENGYDIAVQMDGDGQHSPDYLNAVVAPVANGSVDMCIGSRFITKEGFQTSFARRFGINILSGLIKMLCGVRVRDVTSGFRACNRSLIEYFAQNYAQDFPEPEAIVAAVLNGFTVGEAAVIMHERMGGVSSISAFNSAYYMLKVSISLVVFRICQSRKKAK